MSEHTYEVGDIVKGEDGMTGVLDSPSRSGDTLWRVYWDNDPDRIRLEYEREFEPVVATADHVGRWARVTDQDSDADLRGYRGVVRFVTALGYVDFENLPGNSAGAGCAVLIAPPEPEPKPAWSPVEGGRAVAAVAEWGSGYRPTRASSLRDGDEVNIVRGPDDYGDLWCQTPDYTRWGYVAARHLRPAPEPVDAVIYDYVDEPARLRRTRQALARVKTQRDDLQRHYLAMVEERNDHRATAGRLRQRRDEACAESATLRAERDEARTEVQRLRAEVEDVQEGLRDRDDLFGQVQHLTRELTAAPTVPDPAAGLTVTPDGQRVVDADGMVVAHRGQRTTTHLHADANSNARVTAALRLLADHAEAAEKVPTVDEDAAEVEAIARVMAACWGSPADAWPAWKDDATKAAAAARAARTGDGAA